MKRFLVVLVLVVAVAVGLAFYMGWFAVTWDDAGGNYHFTFTVYTDKVQQDEKKALEKVHGIGHGTKDATPVEKGSPPD